MDDSQELKGTYLTRRTSKEESIVTSMWIPSQPQQQQTTFNPTNQIYKSEIIINQIPKTSVDDNNILLRCDKCKSLIDDKSENEIKFNNRYYHLNCFNCSICRTNLNGSLNNQIKLNDNEQLICLQCQLSEIKICFICHQSIIEGQIIIFDKNNYHQNCFNCGQCRKSLINQTNLRLYNCKPCCFQCFQQYFASRCEKCYQPILNGKSTIFKEKNYHSDCFRCEQCNKIINDIEVLIYNSKPCCIQCYNKYFAPQCSKCLKIISNEKQIIFKENKYHVDCFRCDHCDKIIVDKQIPTHNLKPYCIQCYEQYLAPQCQKCFQPISNGKSIIYSEKSYHVDCFRCIQCNEIINESSFHIENDKPCCNQCFNQYFAPQCSQCLNIISVGKSIIVDGKTYHPDCFRCDQCKQILNNSKFYTYNCKPCCIQCYDQYTALQCSQCFKPIIDKYKTFQGKHFHIQCFICTKCHRIIQSKETFSNRDFGILCSTCDI